MPVTDDGGNRPATPSLTSHREPGLKKTPGQSLGETALKDGIMIIGAAMLMIGFLYLSLRSHVI
jgi:hypothetical protein